MKSQAIKQVFCYIKNYRFSVVFSIITAATSAILALLIPIEIGNAIDLIIGENNVDFVALKPILIKIIVMLSLTAILQWLMNVMNNRIVFGVVSDIRKDTFNHVQRLPLSYIDTHKSGDIVSRIITDAHQFSD